MLVRHTNAHKGTGSLRYACSSIGDHSQRLTKNQLRFSNEKVTISFGKWQEPKAYVSVRNRKEPKEELHSSARFPEITASCFLPQRRSCDSEALAKGMYVIGREGLGDLPSRFWTKNLRCCGLSIGNLQIHVRLGNFFKLRTEVDPAYPHSIMKT